MKLVCSHRRVQSYRCTSRRDDGRRYRGQTHMRTRTAGALVRARDKDEDEELMNRDVSNEDEDRLESGKAGVVCAVAGGLSSLPLAVTTTGHIVSVPVAVVSCALMGVTFRYVVREDWDNFQLKAGAAAAFAVVRAIAIAEAAAERYFVADTAPPLLNTVGEVALLSAQSVVMFGAAAIALEVCIAKGYITPFRASFSRRA